jgi:hypothetical protein
MKIGKYWWLIIALLFINISVFANIPLREGHPVRYQVKAGDNLWDIASRFLKNPWQWNAIWRRNQQITYPTDLYVGDVLELHMVDGQPRMSKITGGTIRLSPEMRVLPFKHPIPTIPVNSLRPFLTLTQLVEDKDAFLSAPYVLSMVGEHLGGGTGSQMFVRALFNNRVRAFGVYRLGKTYRDDITKKKLGYEAQYIGKAILVKPGDPARVFVVDSQGEILQGDRLLPLDESLYSYDFKLHAPNVPIQGSIIGIINDGISQIGKYDVVAIDRGSYDGVEKGDVLDIYNRGKRVVDKQMATRRTNVQLPDTHVGQLLVFRVFHRVSFGLVMDSSSPIHLNDVVDNPDEGQNYADLQNYDR